MSDFKYTVTTAIPIGWDWWVRVTRGGMKMERSGWALTQRRAFRFIDEAVAQCRRLLDGCR